MAVVGLVCLGVVGFTGSAMAVGGECPNAALRVGRSAGLPDCRAYELVTPENLGRTQDMTFTGLDHVIPSPDGEHLALATIVPLEPNPGTSADVVGTIAVFSRTSEGWVMRSATAPGAAADRLEAELFSPDLSQIAGKWITVLNTEEGNAPQTYEVGPVGGPYAVVANVPGGASSHLAGANAGAGGIAAFSHVLFKSEDHELLSAGVERAVAEATVAGLSNLYEWTGGRLRLVNVEGEGTRVKPLDPCGAALGFGRFTIVRGAIGAVSADGSKVFFAPERSGPGCNGLKPLSLYMRVDGRETVEVSRPAPGVELGASERQPVAYMGASPDGSEVFFTTVTPLTPGETPEVKSESKLFMYDTVTRALTLIEGGINTAELARSRFVVSEDGSAVYYEAGGGIHRYETVTGRSSLVARAGDTTVAGEQSYTTPNGRFLVFVSGGGAPVEVPGPHGIEPELRGAGHNELYRYDAMDGSVMCVSCGDGVAPAGAMLEPNTNGGGREAVFNTIEDETPPFVQMSEDGQRVFFETTAQLVPQDKNSSEKHQDIFNAYPGLDVYEWEAFGVEEGPGVFCRVVVGCTHLISTGEDVGAAHFLGASRSGRDLFFETASQLVPQATPEFSNIYDARVGGGFGLPESLSGCLSCHGVGSPSPLFGFGASGTFVGAGNPLVAPSTRSPSKTNVRKLVRCRKGFARSRKRCVKEKRVRKARRGAGR